MCSTAGETCGIFRFTTAYREAWQGMAERRVAGHGGIWLALCVYRCRTAQQEESRDTNATMGILVYDMRTQYTTAITRASQRPGACIACACVRVRVRYIIILLYYYNIIILLYLYIPNIPSIPSIPNIPNISNNGNIAL